MPSLVADTIYAALRNQYGANMVTVNNLAEANTLTAQLHQPGRDITIIELTLTDVKSDETTDLIVVWT